MATIEESIEVQVPVRTAYDQWTQFEEFPRFMDGVESVGSSTTRTCTGSPRSAACAGSGTPRSPSSTPTSAWRGARPTGPTTPAWSPSTASTTHDKVMLQLEFDPDGFVEQVGDKLGIVKRQTKADLDRFKEFIEQRGTETGGWRGDVDRPGT